MLRTIKNDGAKENLLHRISRIMCTKWLMVVVAVVVAKIEAVVIVKCRISIKS